MQHGVHRQPSERLQVADDRLEFCVPLYALRASASQTFPTCNMIRIGLPSAERGIKRLPTNAGFFGDDGHPARGPAMPFAVAMLAAIPVAGSRHLHNRHNLDLAAYFYFSE